LIGGARDALPAGFEAISFDARAEACAARSSENGYIEIKRKAIETSELEARMRAIEARINTNESST
jgi:hypothetical protein